MRRLGHDDARPRAVNSPTWPTLRRQAAQLTLCNSTCATRLGGLETPLLSQVSSLAPRVQGSVDNDEPAMAQVYSVVGKGRCAAPPLRALKPAGSGYFARRNF